MLRDILRLWVDRVVTLEKQRHEHNCFTACSVLASMLDLLAVILIATCPASSFKDNRFALVPKGSQRERGFTAKSTDLCVHHSANAALKTYAQ